MKKFPFEMSKKDKEPKGTKEGSKKEEKLDKAQSKKCGGAVKKMANGGQVRGTGCATKGMKFSGCK